jgi:hypothetical protein
MRPPRIIIGGVFFVATVFLTFLSLRSSHQPQTFTTAAPVAEKSGIQALFSFRAPFQLFPPSAIITLTHDNTTAFLARPAFFGPSLPVYGLKGQVWIGSGFGDDSIRQGAVTAGAEGELGCSDVPGWVDSYAKANAATSEEKPKDGKTAVESVKVKIPKRAINGDGPFKDRNDGTDPRTSVEEASSKPPIDDGTDDYLHHPLPESSVSKSNDKLPADPKVDHADIQSIQEGAEIAGKVVLLSRGGCGFLEKVKWAQRRGAIALIVGDDTKGGPLIQMYARGDTSNVTIPAIFTSHTTAHLLSSLIGPGSYIEDTLDENGRPVMKVQHSKKPGKKNLSRPTFTTTTEVSKPTPTLRPATKVTSKKPTGADKLAPITTQRPGWFRSLFFGSKAGTEESSRPPSSGQLDWVLVDEWKDDDSASSKKISTMPKKKPDGGKKIPSKPKDATKPASKDDFVIGVQDWRDPDLVGSPTPNENQVTGSQVNGKSDPVAKDAPLPTKSGKKHVGGALQDIPKNAPPLQGGSITPGSGEYGTNDVSEDEKTKVVEEISETGSKSKGILTTIFGDDEEDVEFLPPKEHNNEDNGDEGDDDPENEGLWVTLTPTNGASPVLDTLLVLVVSPLVTLTVVYALLLIRSRIRRRRWRAPKSVVERLPVRTYQTIINSGNTSPRIASPTSSSAATPLLQDSPPMRPRPRSRTTTGIPEPGDLARVNSSPLQVPAIPPRVSEHEKDASGSSEWRKHMGKQVECVVCLEEYVAGVSRVMSLPCGHEFHVDCM